MIGQLDTTEIDIARIERGLEDVAELLESTSAYIPIFERLERELADARVKQDTRSRAKKIREARASRNAAVTRDDPER